MRRSTMAVTALLLVLAGCSDDAENGTNGGSGQSGGAGPSSGTGASGATTTTGPGGASSCASPSPDWLLCEDFERGDGDFDAWLAGAAFLDSPGMDDRGRVTLDSGQIHSGSWAAFMPADPASGYQGASLDWYACDGAQETNCPLRSFDTLYMRVWVRFAPDHSIVHHFLNIGGSQPDDFWYHGTAGCMPNGSLDMGTTVDSHTGTHESFFYTYFPGMPCDVNCGNYADVAAICQDCADKGLPTCDQQQQCCWGANIEPDPPHPFPVGQWFCLEMTMSVNTPGQPDGSMAYSIDGTEILRRDDMMFRTSPTLTLNRTRLQHYITTEDAAGHSNQVWFDDAIVSTSPIGCQ
jgi:hypothetical protein